MLNSLPTPILLDIAIVLTALSYAVGLYVADKRVYIFASLAIGAFVCIFGYSVASLGAPLWIVVAAPIPVDILSLWYVLRDARKIVIAYITLWVVYGVIHIIVSAALHYDSLIPAWRLHP